MKKYLAVMKNEAGTNIAPECSPGITKYAHYMLSEGDMLENIVFEGIKQKRLILQEGDYRGAYHMEK